MADKQTAKIGQGKPGPGRPKGSPNRATKDVREAISKLAEGNVERCQEWLDRIAVEDPEKALRLFLDLIEYHIPKLARQEHTGRDGGAVVFEKIVREIVRPQNRNG